MNSINQTLEIIDKIKLQYIELYNEIDDSIGKNEINEFIEEKETKAMRTNIEGFEQLKVEESIDFKKHFDYNTICTGKTVQVGFKFYQSNTIEENGNDSDENQSENENNESNQIQFDFSTSLQRSGSLSDSFDKLKVDQFEFQINQNNNQNNLNNNQQQQTPYKLNFGAQSYQRIKPTQQIEDNN